MGTYYNMSEKERTDLGLFYPWFKDYFLKYAVPGWPLLLLVQLTLRAVMCLTCKGYDVIYIFLPPHNWGFLPLDCAVFGPLNMSLVQCCNYLTTKSSWNES